MGALNSALNQHNDQPISEHLFKILRTPCLQVIRVDSIYENIFDKVEFLIAVNYRFNVREDENPPGRFKLKRRAYVEPVHLLADDVNALLEAGFFGQDIEQYKGLLNLWMQN